MIQTAPTDVPIELSDAQVTARTEAALTEYQEAIDAYCRAEDELHRTLSRPVRFDDLLFCPVLSLLDTLVRRKTLGMLHLAGCKQRMTLADFALRASWKRDCAVDETVKGLVGTGF